jgi:hypothetical protein
VREAGSQPLRRSLSTFTVSSLMTTYDKDSDIYLAGVGYRF